MGRLVGPLPAELERRPHKPARLHVSRTITAAWYVSLRRAPMRSFAFSSPAAQRLDYRWLEQRGFGVLVDAAVKSMRGSLARNWRP